MVMADTVSVRKTLKTLCCGQGDGWWCYAILWRFLHPPNSNSCLLTLQDAYYEEQLGQDIANMLPQLQLLGQGIVGEVAFTGKHRWVHSESDAQTQRLNLTGHHICGNEDDSGLDQQFSSGIQTVVVISLKPWGVVQFGSKKKIPERVEFLEQTQRLLMGILEDERMLNASTDAFLSLDCRNYDLNGMLASISSDTSYDWNLKPVHGDGSQELTGKTYFSASPDDCFPSIYYNILEEETTPLHNNSSCLGDQLTPAIEAQVVFSDRGRTDMLLNSNSPMNGLFARNPSVGTWSGEISSLDSSGQQLLSEIRDQNVADAHYTEANAFACSKPTVQDSELTSLYSMNNLLDPLRGTFQDKLENSLDNQHSAQSSFLTEVNFPDNSSMLHGISKNLKPVDTLEEFSPLCSIDELCQWLAPSPEENICRTVTALDNNLSQSKEFSPIAFGPNGNSSFSDIPVTCPAVHSSITATVNLDGQEISAVMHNSENSLFDSVGLDLSFAQADEWGGGTLTPVVTAATDTGFSECISELNIGTLTSSGKRLFSELGIEELLNGEANSKTLNSSNFEDQLSTNKRQRTDYSPVNRNPTQFANLAWSGAGADFLQHVSDLEKTNNLVHKREIFPKLQLGLWIDDGHGKNNGRAEPAHYQKPVESVTVARKRARPGEGTRPRPKDRQMIQDRIKELRGIIPNGGKCSIDSLLDRTIRYMLFLQSITKYADKLQEPNEPKLIDQANGVVLKDSRVGDSKNDAGVTWAFEVAGQTMVCPIIVEDMGPPGQMLIEMLCEEQGFFLEIVDMIRGFGLRILKGKMEIRETKIWALFIVEANRHVKRIDVFWSLFHLLQQTSTSGIDSANKDYNVINGHNYDKTEIPLPMATTLTEKLW